MERPVLKSLADGLLRLVTTESAEWCAFGAGVERPLKELTARIRRDRGAEDRDGAKTWVPNGVRALFAESKGNGTTAAAVAVARDVGMALYRVDLARVVIQYVGETDKNLDRIFEAAAGAGAIVLFDEADALFGARTEIKDAHDRYASIELSYLLERIERFRGVVILAISSTEKIDPAVLRRFAVTVKF